MRDKIAISCIIKDEEKYIKEFCEHHLSLGFDKIYLGDNTPTDKTSEYCDILKDYIDIGVVEIVDVRGKKTHQLQFYNDMLDRFGMDGETSWCLFIDADEHFTLVKENNVHDFIRRFDAACQILVNWLNMDQCGQTRYCNKPLEERFPNKIDVGESPNGCRFNNHVKAFVKTVDGDRIGTFSNPHYCYNVPMTVDTTNSKIGASPFNNFPNYNIAYIKHFHLKSLQEYVENKMAKGWSDRDGNSLNYFVRDFKYIKPTEDNISWLLEKVYNLTR